MAEQMTRRVPIVMTHAQYATIQAAADEAGLRVATYIRQAALHSAALARKDDLNGAVS